MSKYLIAILVVLALIILGGWYHISAQADTINEQSSVISTKSSVIAQMTADAEDYSNRLRARDSMDAQYQQSIQKVEDEKTALLDRIGSGTQRVYVRATCPKLPDSAATGSADAASPELEPAARQDYANLRAANERVARQVAGLQQYITQQCLAGNQQ